VIVGLSSRNVQQWQGQGKDNVRGGHGCRAAHDTMLCSINRTSAMPWGGQRQGSLRYGQDNSAVYDIMRLSIDAIAGGATMQQRHRCCPNCVHNFGKHVRYLGNGTHPISRDGT
jgi:hypothetical protein